MAFPTTLIDLQDILEVCPVSTELDAQFVRPSIGNAESTQILGIIGKPYYDYLIAAKAANTLLVQDVLVLSEMRKCLAYWTLSLLAKVSSYKLTNKGVVERLDATSKRATPSSIADIAADFSNLAEHYGSLFVDWFVEYVTANPLLFPLVDLTSCPTCCKSKHFRLSTGIIGIPRSAAVKGWNLDLYTPYFNRRNDR